MNYIQYYKCISSSYVNSFLSHYTNTIFVFFEKQLEHSASTLFMTPFKDVGVLVLTETYHQTELLSHCPPGCDVVTALFKIKGNVYT